MSTACCWSTNISSQTGDPLPLASVCLTASLCLSDSAIVLAARCSCNLPLPWFINKPILNITPLWVGWLSAAATDLHRTRINRSRTNACSLNHVIFCICMFSLSGLFSSTIWCHVFFLLVSSCVGVLYLHMTWGEIWAFVFNQLNILTVCAFIFVYLRLSTLYFLLGLLSLWPQKFAFQLFNSAIQLLNCLKHQKEHQVYLL